MKFLTVKQHQMVVQRLVDLGRDIINVKYHSSGVAYTSLQVCFLLENIGAGEALLRLLSSMGDEWFPTTIGYAIVRKMFEVDINAHYVAQEPVKRTNMYINYGRVLKKKRMEACRRHCDSSDEQWAEGMKEEWRQVWETQQDEVNKKYDEVKDEYPRKGYWAGMNIKDMARTVNHEEAYDIFYSDMSSFAHSDVRALNRYLEHDADGPKWSMRASEYDVGNVFRYAAIFLSCNIALFNKEFKCGADSKVEECWAV